MVRAWVGQPKLDAVLRPKLAGGDELGAEPQDAPGEALQNVGEKAYGFNREMNPIDLNSRSSIFSSTRLGL